MHQGHEAVTKAWGVKRGLNTKIHAAVDTNGIPVKFTVTCGIVADCSQACELIDGMTDDRGYGTDKIIIEAGRAGRKVIIFPKKSRKAQREYDKKLYEARHLILKLKE